MEAVRAKGPRPPFWNSKLYGPPLGDFNREPPKEVAVAKGGKDPAPAKHVNVRNAPYQVISMPCRRCSFIKFPANHGNRSFSSSGAVPARGEKCISMAIVLCRSTFVLSWS